MSAVDEFPVPACLVDRRVLRPTPRAQSRNCDKVAQCCLRANVVCGDLIV